MERAAGGPPGRVRLRDLLARPELALRLLHAGADPAAALDRPLALVCTTDLRDPGRYLTGGELVASGLVWRAHPADSDVFVAALARAGAAALAAGEALFGEVPADVVDACRRHGLPLLAVPEQVSFGALTEVVADRVTAARGDRLALSLGRQRRMLDALAGGLGLDELVGEVAAATGRACRVLTATGRPLAGPPAEDPAAVVTAFLAAERLPATGGGCSVFAAGPGDRLAAWCVAVDGPATGWDADTVDVVGELVALAALDRARHVAGEEVAQRVADDALAEIAGGTDRAGTAARLRQTGLDPAAPLVPVVLGLAPADPTLARAVLADVAAHAGRAAVGRLGAVAVALVGDRDGDHPALLAAVHRLAPGLERAGRRLALGVGRPGPPDALAGALREALHAHGLAASRPGPVTVVTGAELTSSVALLAAVPDDARRAFAARLLDPVVAHDARTGAGLLETLDAFLACSGSWTRTAQRMHLHVNTVRYRIGRVAELTGKDLGELADRVDLFLALRSR